MGGIFISYRREDTGGYAGRLYDRLVSHFGRERVFIDVDTIEPGADFVEVIEEKVGLCDALIAVIGKSWLTAVDEHGKRRLDDERDLVRLEITAALKRKVRVIPALVSGASMPRAEELPGDLVLLARRNALHLSDPNFLLEIGRLIEVTETAVKARSRGAQNRPADRSASGRADSRVATDDGPHSGNVNAADPGAQRRAVRPLVLVFGAMAVGILLLFSGAWWLSWSARHRSEHGMAPSFISKATAPDVVPKKAVDTITNSGRVESVGSSFIDAQRLYQKGQYSEAIPLFQQAAFGGSSAAMLALGRIYFGGEGVPKDSSMALQWYKKAATAGNAAAMSYIGGMYQAGWGVTKDDALALQWYKKAAAAGDVGAMTSVAFSYDGKDYVLARQWYSAAAQAGDSGAMYHLGDLYENNRGVPQDYDLARQWYEKAASGGVPAAMLALGTMYHRGLGLARDDAKALQWYKRARATPFEGAAKEADRLIQDLTVEDHKQQ